MRKILILTVALFVLGGCGKGAWETKFSKDFRYRVTLCYLYSTDFLVKEYKIVKSAEKTHLTMRDGLLYPGSRELPGIRFSRFSVDITPAITVSIRELKNVSKKEK